MKNKKEFLGLIFIHNKDYWEKIKNIPVLYLKIIFENNTYLIGNIELSNTDEDFIFEIVGVFFDDIIYSFINTEQKYHLIHFQEYPILGEIKFIEF